MKLLLLTIASLSYNSIDAQVIVQKEAPVISQSTPEKYHYEFKLTGITNPAEAKEITDELRTLFNTPENKYQYFPRFSDDSDSFVFDSEIKVEQEFLVNKLQALGYTVLTFNRN